MLNLCIFVVLFMSVGALETSEERFEKMETRMDAMEGSIQEMEGSIQEILNLLKNQDDVNIAPGQQSDNLKMNDTELEERVQILEFKMGNVQEDLMNVEEDVSTLSEDFETLDAALTDLDEDVENQITVIQADQVVQDQRLLDVEDEVELVGSGIVTIEGTIDELQAVDIELDATIEGLEMANQELASRLDELESRIDDLELGGTVAFHVGLSESEPVIPIGGIAVWDVINVNLGDGYNSVTGEFVVPSGGAGLYYLYAHFRFDSNEYNYMHIRHNGDVLCLALEDKDSSGDFGGASCGAVVELVEGDAVDIYHSAGTDDTPCVGLDFESTFSGFRIAPQ